MRLSALAFVFATLFVQSLPALPALHLQALLLGLSLVAAFAGWRLRGVPSRLLAVLAALAFGIAWASLRAEIRLADELPEAWQGRDVEIVGVVAEMSQPFARGERFVFDVERVLTDGATLPQRVMLSLYRPGQDDEAGAVSLLPGERWRLVVRLKRPHGNANPHAFDYEAWLLERNVRATGYVRTQAAMQRQESFVIAPAYVVERIRHSVRERFLKTLGDDAFGGILIALAIGDQRAIQGEFWQVFSRTGTTHLMSISGLHVTMVAAIFAALAGWAWRRSAPAMARMPAQRVAVLAGWLAAFLYALLSGFSVPAQRTVYMLSIAALSLLTGRRSAPSQVLAAALVLVLLLDPWAVTAPGFWLSFGAVAVLFYVSIGRDEADGGWRQVLARWSAAQWAVTVGLLPLLLLFFQQFSLISPLANAIAIPAISLVVAPLALLAIILPLPAILQFDHWLLALVMELLQRMSEFPVLQLPAPPLPLVVLGLTGIGWMLLPRGIPARWLGAVLLLPALVHQPPRPLPGQAQVDVLDVGQGLAVVVRTATRTLLYDAGPLYSAESDAGQRIVVPYLRAIGVAHLDTLVVTHGDSDHSGGAASVLAALPVARTLSSVDELAGDPCLAGQHWEWDGVRFEILHPSSPGSFVNGRAAKPNNRSCVLRISAAGTSMLLTSDIEAVDERALLERHADRLRADVLLVPHHGSRTSSTPEFVAAVGARHVVYPVGYRNRFGHPRPDVMARYGDARVWRSDRDGAIGIRLGERAELSAWRTERRRYWHGR